MSVHHELPSGRHDGSAKIALYISEHFAVAIVKREGRQPRHPRERVANANGWQRCRRWSTIAAAHPAPLSPGSVPTNGL